MGENVLVTVITVCRNADSTIARALQSVVQQTYAPIEYIVVDGGSSDATLEIVRACPGVARCISEPDNGIADAFNKGIAMARGEWVGILNADDWYEPETVATIMHESVGADVVHGPVRYWEGDAPREVYYPNQSALRREMSINHPSVFVRRSVYDALGGFDVTYKYAMDYELMLRMLAVGCRFHAVEGVVLANMQFGGVSDLHWREALVEVLRAKNCHFSARWSHRVYFCAQLLRGEVRRFLERHGGDRWVRAFRRCWSVMEKRV